MGRAGSGWSRTRPIHPAPFRAPLILHVIIKNALGLGFGLPISWVRETEFCGQRLPGDCRRRTRKNGRNSVRRPRCAPLTAPLPPSTCRKSFLRAQFGEREASAPASPSRGPGNGILRAETGGRFQAQNAGERPEFGSQTATRLTNRPEL